MFEAEAVVTGAAFGTFSVKVITQDCHYCKTGCSKPDWHDSNSIELRNVNQSSSVDLSVGARVFLDVPHKRLISAAFFSYLTPLFGFLVGMVAGNWAAARVVPEFSEACAMIGGLLGMVSVFRCLSSQRVGLSLFELVPSIRPLG
jgi:positive regulator of sigma E activity